MSLLLAIDPGASPSRPGCEARGCRSTSTTSVRAYLGRPHATTIRVCETHRRALEVAGELENPVNCLIPECGRTRATPSRLCAEHAAIVAAAKIRIPKSGVIGTETLLAVRRAIDAEEKRQAAIAAAPLARPQMEERAPDHMGACWRHLADLVPGGTRIDMAVEQVVADLKRTRSIQQETEERRHRAETLLGDAQYLLTELGAPAGSQREDGSLDASITTRIRLLAARPGDLLQVEAIAARVAVCATHGPQATCDEDCCCQTCGRDLIVCADEHSADMLITALRGAAQPTPTVQPDPLRVQATPAEGFGIAIEWTLDAVEAPRAPTLSDRITALAAQRDELRDHLDAIRKALNVGPPSDSDVQPGTSPERLTEIVRARTVCMLDERDQRVALARENQELRAQGAADSKIASANLIGWLSPEAVVELRSRLIDAVAERTVTPDDAKKALRDLSALARIVLTTPDPIGLPF